MKLFPFLLFLSIFGFSQLPDTNKIHRILEEENIVGASLYYLEKDKNHIIYHGLENSSEKIPVHHNTVFEAASLSKPVFAHLCYLLEADSIIDLDEPLHNYLPFKALKEDNAKLITGRMVLQHSTGLPNWIKNSDKAKLKFEPGTKFNYSGEGYMYLQRVIEHLTGETLNELVAKYIFTPYNMNLSSFEYNGELEQVASPHDSKGVPQKKKQTGNFTSAASSLHTTANDYALFLKHYLPTIPQEEIAVDTKKGMYWLPGVGLENTANDTFYWHWGNNWDMFRSVFVYSTEHQKGYILFTNSANGHKVLNELNNLFFKEQLNFVKWIGGS